MTRILILVGLSCVCLASAWAETSGQPRQVALRPGERPAPDRVQAEEKPEPQWVAKVRQVAEKPPSRPRRVVLVFPLVEAGNKEGKLGWDRGLIAMQAMWLSSFAPDRLMDTWDFRVFRCFVDHQLLGAGRTVTPEKVKAICAAADTRNYVSGTLQMTADSYAANLTFQGEKGTKLKTYEGARSELQKLPCRIARDIIDYMAIPLTPEQERALQTPPLSSVELFDEVADHVPGLCYFATDFDPYWEDVVGRCRTTWTEYMYISSISLRNPGWFLNQWGKFAPRGTCAAFDFKKAELAFLAADSQGGSYERAGELLASLLESDPYSPHVVAFLARSLGAAGWPELATKVADRCFAIYGDSLLGPLEHGRFLTDYAWDARGSGWANSVTQEGWKLFNERLTQARAELERVRDGYPLSWQARKCLIPVAMGLNLPRQYAMDQFEAAVAICPTDFEAYGAMMYYLEPRWHGSLQELLSFGRRCAKTELYGTRIPALLAQAHWELASYGTNEGEDDSALARCEVLGRYFKRPEVWQEVEPVLRRTTQENQDDFRDLSYFLMIAYCRKDRDLAAWLFECTQFKSGNRTIDRYDMLCLPPKVFTLIKDWVKQDMTPLHAAAREGRVKEAERLLAEGADVNQRNNEEWTPLHTAARGQQTAMVELLLAKGADINAAAKDGCTALHLCVLDTNLKLAEGLLAKGADIEAKDKDGFTPLTIAARDGLVEMATLLLARGANLEARDKMEGTPLHMAAGMGQMAAVKLFLAKGADVHARASDGATPLHWAAHQDHTEAMEALLAAGADIEELDDNGKSVLYMAAKYSGPRTVQWVLNREAGKGKKVNEALVQPPAAKYPSLETKDKDGLTPLLMAASKGASAVAEVLLAAGADVTAADDRGRTALHLAAENGHLDMARVLLDHKADVNARDKENRTPTFTAVIKGHKEVEDLLKKRGGTE